MKILIAYASKNGTTRSCAERLAEKLKPLDVTVADLNQNKPNVSEFDIVVAGSAIRFGHMLPAAKRFFKEHRETLMQKRLGLFLCCGMAHEYEYYEGVIFSREMREHAFQTLYFGGSLRKDGLPFFDRMIIGSVRSSIMESEIDDGEYTPSLPGILPENIDRMATYVRLELKNAATKEKERNDI